MELLTYSALKKSSILLSPTMNREKDRCGDELIVQFTTMLVANLGRKYNYPISQCQEGSTNQSNVQTLCLPVSPVMSCTAPKTSQDEGRRTWHFIFFPLLFIPRTRQGGALGNATVINCFFLTSHSRGYFSAFWHTSCKHKSGLSWNSIQEM